MLVGIGSIAGPVFCDMFGQDCTGNETIIHFHNNTDQPKKARMICAHVCHSCTVLIVQSFMLQVHEEQM